LLPDKIVKDLGLSFECISREVSSYTPYGVKKGLYVSRIWDSKTEDSFNELDPTGNEGRAWQEFYGEVALFAERIAPTLLEPLKTRSQLKEQIDLDPVWQYLIEEPIGTEITKRFSSDVVRGVVLTDALIGTFASAFDLQSNICFLYHLMGNGTGEWKVPKGGMGALVNELIRVATESGVEISLNSKATHVESNENGVKVSVETDSSEEHSFDVDPNLFVEAAKFANLPDFAHPEIIKALSGMNPEAVDSLATGVVASMFEMQGTDREIWHLAGVLIFQLVHIRCK
jgi:phytoene dehydrogenase-like protein